VIGQAALPMLVAQVLNLLYNIVDRIYIGRIPRIGTTALGSVGLCFPIIIIITAFTNMYGSGGAPLFAIARGHGDDRRAADYQNLSFFLEVVTALVLTAAGLIFGKSVLRLFGASDTAMTYALGYLRIYVLGNIFSMIATGMNPFITAQGFPAAGMITVTIGAVTNFILDPVFIFVLGMGVRGAAVATVLSQALSAAFALYFLRRAQTPIRLQWLRPAQVLAMRERVTDIISLGLASFTQQLTNALVQIVCNRVLATVGGDIYISVMTIVSSVRQMLETPVMAISEGTSPVLSYNYGAGRADRVKQAAVVMTLMCFTYTALTWALILWQPAWFISIFSSDRTILADAIPALKLYFFAFVFMTLQHSGQSVFKSLNKKKQTIFFSLFRKAVIVAPLSIILPLVFGLGTDGVFMAEPISNVVGGTACFVTMLRTVLPELKEMEEEGGRS